MISGETALAFVLEMSARRVQPRELFNGAGDAIIFTKPDKPLSLG